MEARTYVLTPKGYLFSSSVDLDSEKLALGTLIFDDLDSMYDAAAKRFDMQYNEIYGCHYSIVTHSSYRCDRGILCAFNQQEEWDTDMPSPEEFLNDFEL